MKLKTPYKTVMFYGNVLQIPDSSNWIAAFPSGRIAAFMEKPEYNHQDNRWNNGGTTWSPDVYAELEGIDWQDTLIYCPDDQYWMIVVVNKLDAAHFLYTYEGGTAHIAMHDMIDNIAELIRYKSVNCSVRDTFNALMKHATPSYLRASHVRDLLHDKLFPKQKEPEYRIIKNYYGSDVLIPSWATYIAMNRNGAVMAFDMQPDISTGFSWVGGNQKTQVAWRDETTSDVNWQDSLRKI